MDGHCLTNEQILAFSTALFQAERSQATVEKYLRSVRDFFRYLDGRPVAKKCHFGLERFFAAARVRALHRQRFFGSPELPVQLSRLVGLLHTLPENPAPPVSGDRAGAGSSRP